MRNGEDLSKKVLLTHCNQLAADLAHARATVEHLRKEVEELQTTREMHHETDSYNPGPNRPPPGPKITNEFMARQCMKCSTMFPDTFALSTAGNVPCRMCNGRCLSLKVYIGDSE